MEMALFTACILLTLFAGLAFYDGVYLHLLRYRLYARSESRTEHLLHTIRALLFPPLLYFLYLSPGPAGFLVGVVLVLADVLTLGADAYLEKDSRAFMGGLPRWEYILHLFVNGLHFASIAVWLLLKVRLTATGPVLVPMLPATDGYRLLVSLAWNLLPGAVVLGIVHLLLLVPAVATQWERLHARLRCCLPEVFPAGANAPATQATGN